MVADDHSTDPEALFPRHRLNPRLEYMPVFRDTNRVDLRPFPDIEYNTPEAENVMAHLMGVAQITLIIVLGITWYHARFYHREQQVILYRRFAFGENEQKEKRSRSSRSRGNTSGGSKDTTDEDKDWLTTSWDWFCKTVTFKKKGTQPDGTTTRTWLSYFQRSTSKTTKNG
ncbi:hypothetical protein PRIPAC_94863 [Pristionchus pacificus]|uniref:Uncharacterized protein n=1 Tax=Pristionchus pacificus TaxID=54126 RepID=A0A454XW31_PRIPA|nr:hypothetical protein PRIPAC_94863 [Pristionchus pacificus]|eukprot:PDM67902.1 hypothetical protein PRIPAC_45946 [Pristionchus pacificus]